MILTPTILRSQGLRIDAGVSDAVLNRICKDVQVLVEGMIGKERRQAIEALPATDTVIVGGAATDGHYILGLQVSAGYIAYALLLHETVFVSTFGSVIKRDEYSNPATPTDEARAWYARGESGIVAVAEELKERGLAPTAGKLVFPSVPMLAEKAYKFDVEKVWQN